MISSVTQPAGAITPGQTLSSMQMHLGTVVEISGHGDLQSNISDAVAEAFKEVALIHRLMSFHSENSDVSRLNRDAHKGVVTVDARTVEVVRAAGKMSRLSDGVFDITIAPRLVHSGHLPQPTSACVPSSHATWRDIEIVAEDAVVFHKPLWIDLGGIAKGYAVDRAFAACSRSRLIDCLINAGGDIRISDGITGSVTLDIPDGDTEALGCVELAGGSIASSCGLPNARVCDGKTVGCHFDGVTRANVDPNRFVSVLAETCMMADALTNVVLALGELALPILSACAATALVYEKPTGWQQFPPA